MSRCRSCQAHIIWAVTDTGRRMPVDPDPDPQGNLTVWATGEGWRVSVITEDWPESRPRFRPHFATCPDSESWRHR
jgi:hypothetical protein